MATDVSNFDRLPDAAVVPASTLTALAGISASTVWNRVKGDPSFPKPIRLGAKCTRFRVGDIRRYLAGDASA